MWPEERQSPVGLKTKELLEGVRPRARSHQAGAAHMGKLERGREGVQETDGGDSPFPLTLKFPSPS